jgi:hypothetical protein
MKLTPVQLAERVEAWQKRLEPLGVGHFRIECITLTDDVPGAKMDSDAGVSVHADYDLVHFYFNNDFVEASSARVLDETILHEWVHVGMRDYDTAVRVARSRFSDSDWETFDRNIDHNKEKTVDRLAKALYALYKR